MRFLVDENLPEEVAKVLRLAEHDVLYVRRSPYRGASDRELWRLASAEERIIVTRDLDFPLREEPRPAGLMLLRLPDRFTPRQIERALARFMDDAAFASGAGRVTVFQVGRRARSRSL